MPKRFTDRVDPWRLLERGQVIQSSFELASMERLCSLLLAEAGKEQASFNLSFHRDEDRRVIVHCEIRANLTLACQRCLEPMSLPVEIDSRLALVQGMAEAEGLPEALDPLMLADDGLLSIRELVEDELLLAIPDAPKHSEEACAVAVDACTKETDTEQERTEPSPFDVLAVLKKR